MAKPSHACIGGLLIMAPMTRIAILRYPAAIVMLEPFTLRVSGGIF
jgi:hypothetical protein